MKWSESILENINRLWFRILQYDSEIQTESMHDMHKIPETKSSHYLIKSLYLGAAI